MPASMHAVAAHLYHIAILPMWRAPVAAFAVALALRLAGARFGAFAACLGVLAGWLAVQYPGLSVLPARPIDRLPGLAILIVVYAFAAPRTRRAGRLLALPVLALACAWWMDGAPMRGSDIAGVVPVFLGVWVALAVAARIGGKDTGWAGIAASAALAGAIMLSGGAPHWARAALVPACAGLALIGLREAMPALAFATVLTGCVTILASDRGRFVPVDLAVLAPLLAWLLVPLVQPRLSRATPALAAALAAAGGVAVTACAMRALALR